MLLTRACSSAVLLRSPRTRTPASPFSADCFGLLQRKIAVTATSNTLADTSREAVESSDRVPKGRVCKNSTEDDSIRRTVNDLPLEFVENLILKYASVKQPLKLGKRRVTTNIAEEIQRRWNTEDCVKLHAGHKEARANMKTLAFEVEELTGGLVVWVSGSKVIVYSDREHNKVRKQWLIVDKKRRSEQSRMNRHIDR